MREAVHEDRIQALMVLSNCLEHTNTCDVVLQDEDGRMEVVILQLQIHGLANKTGIFRGG